MKWDKENIHSKDDMGSDSRVDADIVRWQRLLRISQHVDITTSRSCRRLVGEDRQFDGVAGFARSRRVLPYVKG